ncbi:CRISPR-associated Cmr4 family protein [Nitrospirillum amazonense]|uniref:CRISPR-associated Cmr4 family protein n=1 Tax=Nitrospirillum amazonense TaxID=28077 RepID=A0A560EL19_9PROT|nr:type III-B CRISPR module RAMP protein Cmr4 [Nitrospirillum amazonense]TWB10070.1 CRISPR-associated Cmr4 family protein [Nitrospirillum amazonense]
MSALMLGLLAETPIHPGSGQDDGTIDLPVQREKITGHPVIPGSSVKGGLRDHVRVRGLDEATVNDWFGKQDNAGAVMVGDARLLLLPVRSLTGAYRWLTCPYLVERLARDLRRAGLDAAGVAAPTLPPAPDAPPVLAAGKTGDDLFLEERSFTITGGVPAGLVAAIGRLIGDDGARNRLAGQIAIVGDDDFAWFARYALTVQARNSLDPDRKTSKNLWYEETLPPDTVFHVSLASRVPGRDEAVAGLGALFREQPYLQLGANETVGQGWFLVQPLAAAVGEG